MNNRRLAIVAGLGVVELWIVGLIIRSIGGGDSHESDFSRPAAHLPYASASQAGANGRTAKTLETGPSPHVVIDDDEATLTVSVASGTSVAVNESLQVSGWVTGARRPATIQRTSDGVRIADPDGGLGVSFGSIRRRLDVVVPPGARLDVENAASISLAGLQADATLHTDDGAIVVTGTRGALSAKTDNGRIELTDIVASSIDVNSDNGRVTLDRVRADNVAIATDNGRIEVTRSLLRGGKIETDSGRIRLALDPSSDITVSARTSSGKVIADAPLTVTNGDDDDAPSTIRVGDGAGRLDVRSDNGSIAILAGRISQQ